MTFDPETSAVAATLIAGYLMTVAGMHKRLLRWRNPPRRCPSCWRLPRECRCRGDARRHGHRRWILR